MLKIFKIRKMVLCYVLLSIITGCKNGIYIDGQSKGYYYENGKKVYGWIKKDNDWYYSMEKGDKGLLIDSRFHDTDYDAYYYFDKYGKMVTDSIVKGMYFGPDGKQVFNSMIEKDGARYQIDVNGNVKKLPVYTFKSDMGMPINIYMNQTLPIKVYWDSRSGQQVLVGTIEEIKFNVTGNTFKISTIARKGPETVVSPGIICKLSMTDNNGVTSAIEGTDRNVDFGNINSGQKAYVDFVFYRSSFPLSGGDIYISFKGGF